MLGKKTNLYFHTDVIVWNGAKWVDLKLILEKYEINNSIGFLWKSQGDIEIGMAVKVVWN